MKFVVSMIAQSFKFLVSSGNRVRNGHGAHDRDGTPAAPAFQYIFTATEPPAELLNKRPWLLDPVLDAAVEEGRLLGIDI